MQCKVDGCNRDAMYRGKQLCQMHYFRVMRNGTTDTLPKTRKYRTQNPAGYQKIYEPSHPLKDSTGYVYEHRFVVYGKYGTSLPACEICGKPTFWDSCHIDHIDKDVTNNKLENLRPVCRGCNTFRDYPEQHLAKNAHSITHNGKTMTATEWARQENVNVCGNTIVRRLREGKSVYEALYGRKITHKRNFGSLQTAAKGVKKWNV